MKTTNPFLSLGFCLLTTSLLTVRAAIESDLLGQAISVPDDARGLVVLAGNVDANDVASVLNKAPVVLLVVTPDEKSRMQQQAALAGAGALGQVSVVTLDKDGRIPLADNSAAVVATDLDTVTSLTESEVKRITRPFGTIHIFKDTQWTKQVKPRPKGMADWTHYHSDPANSEHSPDTHVGPARGIQWIAGPTNRQHANWIKNETVLTTHVARGEDSRIAGLMMRDAFSGLPMWYKPGVQPLTRFAVVLDEKYLYFHGVERAGPQPYTVAFDRVTGKRVRTYDQGLNFTVTDEEKKKDRRAVQYALKRGEDLQFRLVGDVLVQVIRSEIVALDVNTGKRLWDRKVTEGLTFVHPTAGNGVLYIVEGAYTRHSSYTHWPMAKPDRIHALDLRTGKPRWTFKWDQGKHGETHAIYNLQLDGNRLAGAVTIVTKHKPAPHGLVLDAKTGKLIYWGREDKAWPGNTGHGHSHVRLHLRGEEAWTFVIGGPVATWPVDKPTQKTIYPEIYKQNMRPVSCTVWRSTPTWWFGGIGSYPRKAGDRGYFNASGRSNCDIGAFPANGMIYSPPNTCQCQPYLPGNKVYHSRPAPRPVGNDNRLVKGKAESAKPNGNNVKLGWYTWMGDSARRGWHSGTIPTDLKKSWQYRVPESSAAEIVQSQWQTDAFIHGRVTQASCSEGVAVFADPHRHRIIAVDPATGKQRWSTIVDGRVDLAPTIFNGLVYVGTRNGYAYALNRDSGELVWRFTAAPREDRILINGQLESPWPVVGSIPVDEHGLIAIAGRHSDNDGGLWWWQLNPKSGQIIAHGRIGHDEPPAVAANWPRRRPIELPSVQNSVSVMTRDWFIMAGANIHRKDGRLGNKDDDGQLDAQGYATAEQVNEVQKQLRFVRLGSNALYGERSMTSGWRKPYFANTIARIYAIGDGQFISIGGGLGTAGGRGGGGGSFVHRMRLLDKPVPNRRPHLVAHAEEVWKHEDKLLLSREEPSVSALAVSDNAVFIGMSIYGRDKLWREARAKMAHRLRILDMKDGSLIRDVALPARPLPGGVTLADGRVIVATEDGSVTAFEGN